MPPSHSADQFDLNRFVEAQSDLADYAQVISELRSGAKHGHWMWFIFPQWVGLGRSNLAQKFAIKSRNEAYDYLRHPILGPRLLECTQLILETDDRPMIEVFGSPDIRKLKSSMTTLASGQDSIFARVLDKHCSGETDLATVSLWQEDSA